jgi:hypothetical protein
VFRRIAVAGITASVLFVLCLPLSLRWSVYAAFGGAVLVLWLGEKLGIIPSQEAAERNERPPSILSAPDPPK